MQDILLPIIATATPWITARLVKFAIDAKHKQSLTPQEFIFRDGGMPSAHAALVFGLLTTVFVEQGITLLFLVTGVFTFIVAHDAMKVRREAGRHATLLNALYSKKKGFTTLNDRLGHTFMEVFIGACIGVLLPLIVYGVANI